MRCNHEKTVWAGLRLRLIKVFLPLYSVTSQWSDRAKTIEVPLFPGYLFVRLAEAGLAAALDVAGVLGVLDSKLWPVEIPDSEIENIRRVLASLLPFSPADLVPGDSVTVRSGPLRGVAGVVVRRAGGVRLIVSIELLNRAVAVEIDGADLLAVV